MTAKEFIEENIELIEDEDFKTSYKLAFNEFMIPISSTCISEVTQLLMTAHINPLEYLDEIPDLYAIDNIQITTLDIPSHIKQIGQGAFCGCINLFSINIPEGIKELPYRVFARCEKLESITIPNSVTSILYDAFGDCKNLKNISFNGTIEEWNKVRIEKGISSPFVNVPAKMINCKDGFTNLRQIKKKTKLGFH